MSLLVSAACGDDGGGSDGAGGSGATGSGGGGSGGGVSIQCEDETCSYCCNYGTCADTEDACFEGATEGGRPILLCDGPEDCSDDRMLCCAGVPATSFAITAECTPLEECHSYEMPLFFCHEHSDCGDFAQCVPWEDHPYLKVCDFV